MVVIDQKLVLLGSLFFAFACAFLARKSKRSPYLWFLSGFFFGIFSFLTLGFLNYLERKGRKSRPGQPSPPPKPNFSLFSQNEHLWYYLNAKNHAVGPMSLKRLFEEYEKGLLDPKTYLWHDEMTDWKKLEEIQDIKKIFTRKPSLSRE